MLGRAILFAGGAIVFAVLVTPRTKMAVADADVPAAAPTHKKNSFFDPIPPNVVHSSRLKGGPSQVTGSGTTTLTRGPGGHFFTSASINGHRVMAIVDTGATSVALSVEDARAAGIPVDVNRFRVIGTGASGPVRGMRINLSEVQVGNHRVTNVRGAVLEGLEGTLLGQSFLRHLDKVEISGDRMTLS